MDSFRSLLKENDIEYAVNVSFKKLTSYKTGGNASIVVYPKNKKELVFVIKKIKKYKFKYTLFGSGTNMLASDSDYDGVIIKLDKFDEIKIEDDIVTVGCGVSMSKLCVLLAKKGYKGYANLAGIPGTVGGAIYMNAGCYGVEIKDLLIDAVYFKLGKNIIVTNKMFCFKKRHSIIQWLKTPILLEARFKLEKSDEDEILKLDEYREKRTSSQPLDKPNCGSVFKNPEGDSAGRLIDSCGLKGYKIGGASVSEKHANFIVNDGTATSADILNIIEYVSTKVLNETGVKLELEVKLFNF